MLCALCQFDSETSPCTACGNDYCPDCMTWHECEKPSGLYPHQERGLREIEEAVAGGEKRICVTSPTGGGKTRMMIEQARKAAKSGRRVVIYTHRRTLIGQTARKFSEQGVSHGMLASGHKTAFLRDIQIASIWTVNARVYGAKSWELWNADEVIVDEAHNLGHETARKILDEHASHGALITGYTATPVNIGHVYKYLVTAGTNSELRDLGLLVPCDVYGPDEPDLTRVRTNQNGEYVVEDVVKRVMVAARGEKRPRIFGRVLEHFEQLNPDRHPTVLFAPDVPSSRWFSEFLTDNGVQAAHIDAETPDDERETIFKMLANGDLQVVCNRFVLREGWDAPFVRHLILATAFGAPSNWLQAVGRVLRASPSTGKTKAVLQDHGGCLDEKTEILTKRGWATHKTIRQDDLVAGFDRNTLEISWQPILHKHVRTLSMGERLYHACGRSCDILVTGNHRLLCRYRTSDGSGTPCWPTSYKFMRADELAASRSRYKVPVSGYQNSPGVPLSDDELRFVGWFVTDGTMDRAAVTITQANHQPHIADLRRCLVGCGFDFREYERRPTYFSGSKTQTVFAVPKGTCRARPRNGWSRLAPYLDKDLSPLLDDMTTRQLGVFLHAIHLGDGKKDGRTSYCIGTGNRTFADRLQSLCVRHGLRCNISIESGDRRRRPLYLMRITRADSHILHGPNRASGQVALEAQPRGSHSDTVWCVANPLETLVIRRNGKVAIVGNSWHRDGFGSPNQDRQWSLDDSDIGLVKKARLVRETENNPEREPIVCPRCSAIRKAGDTCPYCGFQWNKRQRVVIQTDGSLKRMSMPKITRKAETPDAVKHWKAAFWAAAARGGKKTFNQIRADWQRRMQTTSYPPFGMQNMPAKGSPDWDRRLVDVYPNVVSSLQQRRKAKQ